MEHEFERQVTHGPPQLQPPRPGPDMRGDRVEILVEAGDGVRAYEVAATRAGRRVDVSIIRNVVTVSEVTRGGTVVRTARFMASRVLALVEHPARQPAQPDDEGQEPAA
jgi:hypothetical protein